MPEEKYYRKRQVPDGGWGWAVCFGSFLLQVLTNGVICSFGIVFVDLIRYFETTQSVTAWIGSIQASFLNLSGILTAPLLHKFGWRAVTIAGGILSTIGFGTSALATNIYILYFTYGFLTGIGNGFMFITSIVIVQQYFSKRRALANGIAVSGSGVGALVFAIVTQNLISSLGWKLMVVYNAVITLIISVGCGMLYRPLPYETMRVVNDDTKPHQPHRPNLDTISEENPNNGLTDSINRHKKYGSLSGSYEIVQALTVRRSAPILCTVPSLIEDSGIFDFEFMEFPLASESKLSPETLRKYKQVSAIHQMWLILKEMIDFSLFKNCVFNLFTFAVITFTYSFMIVYNFLPEWGMTVGATYPEASLLVSITGVSSIFTRLFCGWIADKIPNRRFDLLGIILTLEGILALTSAAFTNYPLLIVYSILMGFLIGGIFTLYPVILVDLLGREVFDKALGLVLATRSVACLTAGPISGLIIDESGNLHDVIIPFMAIGGALCLGGFAYFLIRCSLPKSYSLRDNSAFIKSQPKYDAGSQQNIEEAQPFQIGDNTEVSHFNPYGESHTAPDHDTATTKESAIGEHERPSFVVG